MHQSPEQADLKALIDMSAWKANHLVPTLHQISKTKTPLLVPQSIMKSGYHSAITIGNTSNFYWLVLIK